MDFMRVTNTKSVRMSESPVHLLIFQPEFRNNPYKTD